MSSLIRYKNKPSVLGYAAVVGQKEYEGPLGHEFDAHSHDDKFGTDTWEKAESEMQRQTFNLLMKKTGIEQENIQAIFAGDLQNQCVGSAYGLVSYDIPYFGLYGACSTMAESLLLSSMMVAGGFAETTAAISSSHYCSAERQFRFPIEYGGQRTPTAQWTVTGAGGVLVGNGQGTVVISEVLPGRVIDKGIKDTNNMGAAMAPAFIDTLTRFFTESGTKPDDYDSILSGDLGAVGHEIASELMGAAGFDLSRVYNDCGLMMFDMEKQDVHAGGSGCGCSGAVLCGHILKKMEARELNEVLLLCTGAMMSPGSLMQGLSIPSIAHLIHFSTNAKKAGGNKCV